MNRNHTVRRVAAVATNGYESRMCAATCAENIDLLQQKEAKRGEYERTNIMNRQARRDETTISMQQDNFNLFILITESEAFLRMVDTTNGLYSKQQSRN